MRGTCWVIAVIFAASLAACSPPDDTYGNPSEGYLDDTVDIADKVDWDAAESVVIELSEFNYTPRILTFRRGRPYALTLTNTGAVTHRFGATEFFRAIAVRSVVYSDAEAGYPVLEAMALDSKETKTINFVPVIAGTYQVSCDRLFHTLLGMTGHLVIE